MVESREDRFTALERKLGEANSALASLQIDNEILKSRVAMTSKGRSGRRAGSMLLVGGTGVIGFALAALPGLIQGGGLVLALGGGGVGAFIGMMAWLYGSIEPRDPDPGVHVDGP
jgi:hypothetical protein